jgi:hypothetical protein
MKAFENGALRGLDVSNSQSYPQNTGVIFVYDKSRT